MKNSILKYTLACVLLGVLVTTISVAFASKGIVAKACPPKPKKVFSGTMQFNEEHKSTYDFTTRQGTFALLRGYIKNACPMSVVVSSDIQDRVYSCKSAGAVTGKYTSFSCRFGGSEKEQAIDASAGQILTDPYISIGLGYQDKMGVTFEGQREDGMYAGYLLPVITDASSDVEVSVFAGH